METIKLKNSELLNLNDSLVELAILNAPSNIAYAVARNLSKIEEAYNSYDREKRNIIDKYCERDSKNKPKYKTVTEGGVLMNKPVFPIPNIDGAKFVTEEEQKKESERIYSETEQEIRLKLAEIKDVEKDVEIYRKISAWELDKFREINGSIIYKIDKLIDHEATVEPKILKVN